MVASPGLQEPEGGLARSAVSHTRSQRVVKQRSFWASSLLRSGYTRRMVYCIFISLRISVLSCGATAAIHLCKSFRQPYWGQYTKRYIDFVNFSAVPKACNRAPLQFSKLPHHSRHPTRMMLLLLHKWRCVYCQRYRTGTRKKVLISGSEAAKFAEACRSEMSAYYVRMLIFCTHDEGKLQSRAIADRTCDVKSTFLDSYVAGNNRPLYPKVDHYCF